MERDRGVCVGVRESEGARSVLFSERDPLLALAKVHPFLKMQA